MLSRSFRLVLAAAALALVAIGSASAEAPQMNSNATITGSAVVGSELTAHNGTWLYDNGTSCKSECVMTYQWQRCNAAGSSCADISGANSRFYTVQAADAGSKLRAMETMSIYDCGAHNTQTGQIECNWTRRSAPSGMSAVVPGSAPPTGTTPTTPTAPQPAAPAAPAVTAAPTISGLPMVDQKLTATRGTWGGSQPLTLALQWQRCDGSGQNCQDLGLSGDLYTVIRFDVGKTLRVRVTAVNAGGAREVFSATTPVVSELMPTGQSPTLAASKVSAPHRLVVDQITPTPQRLTRRTTVDVKLRVSDTRGFLIQGAIVTAVVLPAGSLVPPAAAESDEQGLVTLTFSPGRKFNTKKLKLVTIVVTARRPGDRVTSPRASIVRVKIPVVATAKRTR
jgi:hypothetical protein